MNIFFISAVLLLIAAAPAAHSLLDPFPEVPFPDSPAPLTTPSPSPSPSPSALSDPTQEDVDFVRRSCAITEYQRECFESLSHYAAAAHSSPIRLVRIAIAVALSKARAETAYFNSLSKQADYGAVDRRATASALRDCFSQFDDVVDSIQGSLKQMRSLVGRDSQSFLFQMSNVQTWMSAALTSEDTCKDGFEGIGESPVKSDVFERVQRVEAATSNALALVNSYAVRV